MRMPEAGTMTVVIERSRIAEALEKVDVIACMGEAFAAYSAGRCTVPPVGELLFHQPPGEAHIKYGYIHGDDVFVIKVATGFYKNTERGLPPNSGVMLVFCARTGLAKYVLLDEGHLTNERTAAAGAYAAKLLAPPSLNSIAVIGSGVQARLQCRYLKNITDCRAVMLYARNADKAGQAAADIQNDGFEVKVAASAEAAVQQADLIITTTASTAPILQAEWIKPGTHIVAVGSDTPEKIELHPDVLGRAALVVADSRAQCFERGEIHHALAAGAIKAADICEIGELSADIGTKIHSRPAITISDLTGVAVQDIEICKAVINGLTTHPSGSAS